MSVTNTWRGRVRDCFNASTIVALSTLGYLLLIVVIPLWLLGPPVPIDTNAKDVGVVLNFEARGNQGPSVLFETSTDHDWLLRAYREAAPHPCAFSYSYEIYKRLPNDTDLTVFKQNGYQGLNFGYFGGFLHYHTRLDTAGSVDQGSLQHHGSHALSLARSLGDMDLNNPGEGNSIYFSLLGAVTLGPVE